MPYLEDKSFMQLQLLAPFYISTDKNECENIRLWQHNPKYSTLLFCMKNVFHMNGEKKPTTLMSSVFF